MTKNERMAFIMLLGTARSAVSEIESYCRDFDSSTLKEVAEDLRRGIEEARKAAKV